ncbi:hypothetical protein [Methylobacterium haplocladii]|uniref:Uncharacterized protein n=1 Tax=Methylobacterium haplocladii TaxID=1176176 RepID=A0A512IPH7_9HYPH|nr:hypothetical protein [Methylobacterium haplocladii]GEO99572.1 hypothetical protein MHA02_19600 [Methylobacterium haplocladii]GLS58548.1 hypothetical protein GCM10007887_12120 [Methylobacterium haplocladii]
MDSLASVLTNGCGEDAETCAADHGPSADESPRRETASQRPTAEDAGGPEIPASTLRQAVPRTSASVGSAPADVIPLPIRLDADTTHRLLQDLQRRIASGEDLGDRRVHIHQIAVGLQRSVAALAAMLTSLDQAGSGSDELWAVGETTLVLAERNLRMARTLLGHRLPASCL